MPTPLLRGHAPGMGDSMPSERRAGHATLDEQGLPLDLGTPAAIDSAEPAVVRPGYYNAAELGDNVTREQAGVHEKDGGGG